MEAPCTLPQEEHETEALEQQEESHAQEHSPELTVDTETQQQGEGTYIETQAELPTDDAHADIQAGSPQSEQTALGIVLHEGVLSKMGTRRRHAWQKRWFVLYGDSLQYFESEKQARTSSHSRKQIPIFTDSAVMVEMEDKTKSGYHLEFSSTACDRCYQLAAATMEERTVWVNALREAIANSTQKGADYDSDEGYQFGGSLRSLQRDRQGTQLLINDTESPVFSGNLQKKGTHRRNWKPRWVELFTHCVRYCPSKSQRDKPKGEFRIGPFSTVTIEVPEKTKSGFRFEVSPNDNARVFFFAAESEALRGQWVDLMRDHIALAKTQSPRHRVSPCLTPRLDLSKPVSRSIRLRSGYLHKKGRERHNWKRRFCMLSPGGIQYFESNKPKDMVTPKGGLRLTTESLVTVECEAQTKIGFRFEVSTDDNARVFVFACKDETDRTEWVAAINSAVQGMKAKNGG